MKGIICYYSGSGNTKLAMEYLSKKISNIEFELYNIVKNEVPDFSKYDIVGFATFADYLSPPQLFYDFFKKVKTQDNRPAFIFNTYGGITGTTLKDIAKLAKSKGFYVLSGFSLHMPQSYPPMRKNNMPSDNAPTSKEAYEFNEYITILDNQLGEVKSGKKVISKKIPTGGMMGFAPKFPRTQAKKGFGIQNVNEELCIECGLCKKTCPYEAIEMSPKPDFDHDKCYGCWGCYNHCPKKAIYTKKFNGEYQYKEPTKELLKKLG